MNNMYMKKKMFNNTNHQGNANQIHNEPSFTLARWASIKVIIDKNNKCWQGCEEKETLACSDRCSNK